LRTCRATNFAAARIVRKTAPSLPARARRGRHEIGHARGRNGGPQFGVKRRINLALTCSDGCLSTLCFANANPILRVGRS